jgi:DNA-binding NarL/FixJ family response regulator
MKTRISIFEDYSNLRIALQTMLNAIEEFEVVSTHPNCKSADIHVKEFNPSYILMDIDMPEVNGIEGVKMIKASSPHVTIIMLTVFDDDEKIFQAFRAGADGYLLKNVVGEQLIPMIKSGILGGASISPGVALKVLKTFKQKIEGNSAFLNEQETKVLEFLVLGLSYKQIASQLSIEEDSLRNLIVNIQLKLQLNFATSAGLIKVLEMKLEALKM